jgi:hypothetical protein
VGTGCPPSRSVHVPLIWTPCPTRDIENRSFAQVLTSPLKRSPVIHDAWCTVAEGLAFDGLIFEGGTMSRFAAFGGRGIGDQSWGGAGGGLIGIVAAFTAVMALAVPSAAVACQPTDYAGCERP